MLSSLIEQDADRFADPDLENLKVLVSGYAPEVAAALVRAFAEARAHVLIQTPRCEPDLIEAGAGNGDRATVEWTGSALASTAARYARKASQAPGGLDAVVAIVSPDIDTRSDILEREDVDEAIHDLLLPAALVTRVTANRMRVLMKEGTILAVVVTPPAVTGKEQAFQAYARAALRAMVRIEASEWAVHGIAVNGVMCAPEAAEDAAAVAVQLARPEGYRVSGHVVDVTGAATLVC